MPFSGLVMYLECKQMPPFPYNPQALSPDSWPQRRDAQTSVISDVSAGKHQFLGVFLDSWHSCLKDEPLKIECFPLASLRGVLGLVAE